MISARNSDHCPLHCTHAQVLDTPAVLDRCNGKSQEKKALKPFLQNHFWITKSSSVSFLCFWSINVLTVISLEESISKYYFPGIFSNVLLTFLNSKSAEDICMTLFLPYNLIFLLYFLFTGDLLDLFKWLITRVSDGSLIPTSCISTKKVFQQQVISCWLSVVYNEP